MSDHSITSLIEKLEGEKQGHIRHWEVEPTDSAILILEACEIGKGLVAEVTHYFKEPERNLERARLIAAAPDLLAVAIKSHEPYEGLDEAEIWDFYGQEEAELAMSLRAAIAKANGDPDAQ